MNRRSGTRWKRRTKAERAARARAVPFRRVARLLRRWFYGAQRAVREGRYVGPLIFHGESAGSSSALLRLEDLDEFAWAPGEMRYLTDDEALKLAAKVGPGGFEGPQLEWRRP
jgi:hypothetical protein